MKDTYTTKFYRYDCIYLYNIGKVYKEITKLYIEINIYIEILK